MCGIFGGIKNVKSENLKLLGVLNEDRGTDSTGMFDMDGYIKDAQSFRRFILHDTSNFIKNFKGYLVGHTRFATTGQKTARNAHPFEYGTILGVHNGVITNFETLKLKYKQIDMECDSEILFYLLDTKGVEGLKEVTGYYTIVWSDSTKPNKLFIINHSCTLAYCRGKDYLYFCSDYEDLEVTLGYNSKIIEILENTLYEIDINTLKISKTKVKGLNKYIYKPKQIYSQYDTISSYELAYTKDEYYQELDREFDEQNKKLLENKKQLEQNSFRDYLIICPYCNEGLYTDEALKGQCCYCHTELSGVIYCCYHCESLVLAEQIETDERCPICSLHMKLDNDYLVTV